MMIYTPLLHIHCFIGQLFFLFKIPEHDFCDSQPGTKAETKPHSSRGGGADFSRNGLDLVRLKYVWSVYYTSSFLLNVVFIKKKLNLNSKKNT